MNSGSTTQLIKLLVIILIPIRNLLNKYRQNTSLKNPFMI